jgi:hypothetical protein
MHRVIIREQRSEVQLKFGRVAVQRSLHQLHHKQFEFHHVPPPKGLSCTRTSPVHQHTQPTVCVVSLTSKLELGASVDALAGLRC